MITAAPTGCLYLVPAPLDFGCSEVVPLAEVLPAATIATAARLTHWICENAKSTRSLLNRIGELQPVLVLRDSLRSWLDKKAPEQREPVEDGVQQDRRVDAAAPGPDEREQRAEDGEQQEPLDETVHGRER